MEQAKALLACKLDGIQLALRGSLQPFKKYSQVDEFMEQFNEIRGRYKFLVLEGQSRTGKTFFAKWLLQNPDRVFETNCASCPEPDLRDFNALYHQVILFDEASPEMVIRQKKLFQGPPCFVEMGSSATNCHSYRVLVSGIRLVICSNGWSEAVCRMQSKADRDWLRENSFIVDVGYEAMYL